MLVAGPQHHYCPQCQRPFFQAAEHCAACGWTDAKASEREARALAYQRARKPLRARAAIAITGVGLGAVLLFMGVLRQHQDLLVLGRAIGFGSFLLYGLTRWRLWRLQKLRNFPG